MDWSGLVLERSGINEQFEPYQCHCGPTVG
jgi:hypothetical protein